jgi:hypothetical protein
VNDTHDDDPTVGVSRDLHEIERLCAWLRDQALHRGNDKTMIGGDSMAALGPMSPLSRADAVEFIERWNADHYGEACAVDLSHLNDEPENPDADLLTTLLWWSEDFRKRAGSTMPHRPSIASEADWLRSALPWIYDNEPDWAEFCDDVNQVRVAMENLLRAGVRSSRTRVPCLDCSTRLIRVYQPKAADDYHKCPWCKRKYGSEEFDRAKANWFASKPAERFVKMQDARDLVCDKQRPDGGRPLRTFRKWLSEGLIRTSRDDLTGQLLIWWPDVRELDQTTPRRKRDRMSA